MKLHIREVASAIGAVCPCGEEVWIERVVTDSRELAGGGTGGSLFVAIVGERVDGHTYIPQVLAADLRAFAVAHRPVEGDQSRILYVKDTFPVLMDLARYYRQRFTLRAVGITGSVGKTTTKEFTAAVVAQRFKTLKNEGNRNNELGLPNTVFQLDDSYEAAVLEMGMDHLGDIHNLTTIVRPEVGVVTNIGVSHLEKLGTRENILQAKLEIKDGMADGSVLLLNGDNDLLHGHRDSRLDVRFFGIEDPTCTYWAQGVTERPDGMDFVIRWGKEQAPVHIPALGRHNVYNALAAFAVGDCLDVPVERRVAALAAYTSTGRRQKQVDFAGCTVVEDCYNASPDSMRAALEVLHGYPCTGRKIAVLGDMLELGAVSQEAHLEVGRMAAKQGVDLLFAFGPQAWYYIQGAREAGLEAAVHCDTHEELARQVRAAMEPGDLVWVKGSLGMALEKMLTLLYA